MTDPPHSCQSHQYSLGCRVLHLTWGVYYLHCNFTFQQYLKRLTCLPSWGFPHSAHTRLQSCGFLPITSNFFVHFFGVSAWSLNFGASHDWDVCLFLLLFLHLLFKKYWFIYLTALGLTCGVWDPVLWPGVKPGPSALGVQSLSHWTTREVHTLAFKDLIHLHKLTYWLYGHKLPILNWYLQPKLWAPDVGTHLDTQFGYPRDVSNLIHQNLNLSPISSRTPHTLSFEPNM